MSYFRQLTQGVLQAYANINVLVVATENITSEWYKGAAPAECRAGFSSSAWPNLSAWQHVA